MADFERTINFRAEGLGELVEGTRELSKILAEMKASGVQLSPVQRSDVQATSEMAASMKIVSTFIETIVERAEEISPELQRAVRGLQQVRTEVKETGQAAKKEIDYFAKASKDIKKSWSDFKKDFPNIGKGGLAFLKEFGQVSGASKVGRDIFGEGASITGRFLGRQAADFTGLFSPLTSIPMSLFSTLLGADTMKSTRVSTLLGLGIPGVTQTAGKKGQAQLGAMTGSVGMTEDRAAALIKGFVEGGGVNGVDRVLGNVDAVNSMKESAVLLYGGIEGIGQAAQDTGYFMDNLNESFEGVTSSMRMVAAGAERSELSTSRYIQTLRSGVEMTSKYGSKTEDLVRTLGRLGKGSLAIKNFEALMGGLSGLSEEHMAFTGSLGKDALRKGLTRQMAQVGNKSGKDSAEYLELQGALAGLSSGDPYATIRAMGLASAQTRFSTLSQASAALGRGAFTKESLLSESAKESRIRMSSMFGVEGAQAEKLAAALRAYALDEEGADLKEFAGLGDTGATIDDLIKSSTSLENQIKMLVEELTKSLGELLPIREGLDKLVSLLDAIVHPTSSVTEWAAGVSAGFFPELDTRAAWPSVNADAEKFEKAALQRLGPPTLSKRGNPIVTINGREVEIKVTATETGTDSRQLTSQNAQDRARSMK